MPGNFPTKKKTFGNYCIPSEVTEILCDWAIRDSKDNVLEPSFDASRFLGALRDRLLKLNNPEPIRQLYGSDVDLNAFTNYLNLKFPNQSLETLFFNRDFLSLPHTDFPISSFDVVLGNSPNVSYHNMTPEKRRSITTVLAQTPIQSSTLITGSCTSGAISTEKAEVLIVYCRRRI